MLKETNLNAKPKAATLITLITLLFLCFLCALSINLAKFNSLIIRTAGISNPSPLANWCSLIKQKPVRDGLI